MKQTLLHGHKLKNETNGRDGLQQGNIRTKKKILVL